VIKWSKDSSLAQKILLMDEVWPWISDDSCNKESFILPDIDGDRIRLALCIYDEKLYGCFILFEQSPKITEIHTCLFIHGKSKYFGDLVVERIFSDTDYDVIETFVPVDNPAAKKLAEKCGFVVTGEKEPIIKNGKSIKVELMELKRCQQH
jgi:RimJ/RimL family protein N-acetyltransferase